MEPGPDAKTLAARCYDVTVALQNKSVGDFDNLTAIGRAVRLALHLRGCPAVEYELLKQVAHYLLHINPTELRDTVYLLAEAEFVRLGTEGKTIRTVVPTVPHYEDLFAGAGHLATTRALTEAEQLTVLVLDRLARAPTPKSTVYELGAERKLVDRMLHVGSQAGYVLSRRRRGKDFLLSPVYFPENMDQFADVTAAHGSSRVRRVLNLISRNQGWPLSLAQTSKQIGEEPLDDEDLKVIIGLADGGISPTPMIQTAHAGSTHFIFSPKPGIARVSPVKRPIFEAAMALVAAVRQGQLLPKECRIRSPYALLAALQDRKRLRANTESLEQYRQLVALRVGRLVNAGGSYYRFELIDTPENVEAVQMAMALVTGGEPGPTPEEEAVLALRKGQTFFDSIVGRKELVEKERIQLDPETQQEIDDLLLRGAL